MLNLTYQEGERIKRELDESCAVAADEGGQ